MTGAEREAARRRLRIWREAEPFLAEQRWRELIALSDADALQMTKSLLGRPGIVPVPRDTSGLVEQQALFRQSHRR
jgi:hypothetical protein